MPTGLLLLKSILLLHTKMEKYQQLIAEGNTEEALDLLLEQRGQYAANTSKAIVVLKAAWINLKNQQMLGVIAGEEAERIRNRINMGVLDVAQDIELNGGGSIVNLHGINSDLVNEQTSPIVQQIEHAQYHTVSDNKVEVHQAKNVIVGSGNTITTKVNKGWGIWQYASLLLAICILGYGGWYAFQSLGAANDNMMFSLSKVRSEIESLAKKDNAVKAAFDPGMQEQLELGWNDLESGHYAQAIEKLDAVAQVIPAPKLLLQLGLAYRKNKDERYAQKYMLEAFEKSPVVKREYIETLKGERINLLDVTTGTSVKKATEVDWKNALYYDGYFQGQIPSEAVFGFGNDKAATFDLFEVKIDKTHYYNPKNIELYSADTPNGEFRKIAAIQVENIYTEGGFQQFPIPATTCKYIKIKVLDVYGGSFGVVPDMTLMGTLQ